MNSRKRPYDKVTPDLRALVFRRDGECFLAKVEPDHLCRDIWGNAHRANDWDRLTLEHVHYQTMMGRRAPSDPQHLVALCGAANFGVPSKSQRDSMRAYLRALYPEAVPA